MHYTDVLEHGVAVVCDYGFAAPGLDHFVHAAWAEGGADGVCDCARGLDVGLSDGGGFAFVLFDIISLVLSAVNSSVEGCVCEGRI